jgi:hypothetical protein
MTPAASAQGPVRQGLRATGEAAAGVARGAGQAAAGVAQGAADVAAGTARAAVGGVRAGVDALTPGIPWQGRLGVNLGLADRAYNAGWRMQRHNGEWWYFSPQNSWMYHRDGRWNNFAANSFTPSPYATGYRGVDQGGQQFEQGHQGQQGQQISGQQVRTDAQGRQYICDNGQPVYLDEQGQMSGEYSAAHSGTFQQGQGQQQGGQLQPIPAQPEQPAQGAAQAGAQTGAAQPQAAPQQPLQPQAQAEQSTLQQNQPAQPQAQPQPQPGAAPSSGPSY